MSVAEIFLLVWAVGATIVIGLLHAVLKRAVMHHKMISVLMAEVALGDVVPKDAGNGYISVENDDMRMTFKKVEG
jgi:hypothetical protein